MALPPFRCLSDRHSDREEKGPSCWLTRAIDACSIGQQYSRAHKLTGDFAYFLQRLQLAAVDIKGFRFHILFVFSSLVRPLLLALQRGREKGEANAFFSTNYMY